MQKERTFKQKTILFLKGLAMGAANKVPGVSGGTVSYVLGFYEELIYSFRKINLKAFKLLISGEFKLFFKYTNAQFISLVMFGSVFSYFSISIVLDYFLKNYELYVWSWFFGMIIGSIYYMGKDFGKWSRKNFIFLIFGVTIGLGISFLTPAIENDNLWFVFLCGVIGVSGMTLPGLSGSFILILLGNYVLLLVDSVNVLLNIITNILTGNFEVLSDPIKIKYLKIIAVFTGGSAFGLVSFSHVLGYVLKRWNRIVNAIIIGFITGSLGIVWPWKRVVYSRKENVFLLDKEGNKIIKNYERFVPEIFSIETLLAIFFIFLGVALILVIDYYDRRKEKKVFGLLGKNISYSFSKGYFSTKFKNLNLRRYKYLNFDIQKIQDFPSIILRKKNLTGLNVTIPYKVEIMPFLDKIDKTARVIGAVNTIKITKKGKLKGYNSDVVGFEKSLKPLLKSHHKKALILGTGGASKAIAYALKLNQIEYKFVSRNPVDSNQISYESLSEEIIKEYTVIINCTPLGTSPNIKKYPKIPYCFITENHLLYDLIYNPEVTKFLSKGKEKGATIKNGYEMLTLQAEESWRIWNE